MPDTMLVLSGIGVLLGGVNLAFIIKLMYNDLREVEKKLDRHIEWHLKDG